MNTKKILGVVAVLALVAVALVGAGAATGEQTESSVAYITVGETTTYYDTLAAAVTAARTTDVDTIVIIKNNNLAADLTIDKSLNIVGDGKAAYEIGLADHKLNIDGNITVSLGKAESKGVTFKETYGTNAFQLVNITGNPVVNDFAYTVTGTAAVLNSGDFVTIGVAGSTTNVVINNSIFDFSGVTNTETETDPTLIGVVIGPVGSGSSLNGNVVLNNCTIKNGNSNIHKSQSVVIGNHVGTITFNGGSIVESGVSNEHRESVCLRVTAQKAGENNVITLRNTTLKGVANAKKTVGIAIDQAGASAVDAGSVVEIDDVTFNLGTNGYAIWKEECAADTYVKFDNGSYDGINVVFVDCSTSSAPATTGKITFSGDAIPANYIITVKSCDKSTGGPYVVAAPTFVNAMALANKATGTVGVSVEDITYGSPTVTVGENVEVYIQKITTDDVTGITNNGKILVDDSDVFEKIAEDVGGYIVVGKSFTNAHDIAFKGAVTVNSNAASAANVVEIIDNVTLTLTGTITGTATFDGNGTLSVAKNLPNTITVTGTVEVTGTTTSPAVSVEVPIVNDVPVGHVVWYDIVGDSVASINGLTSNSTDWNISDITNKTAIIPNLNSVTPVYSQELIGFTNVNGLILFDSENGIIGVIIAFTDNAASTFTGFSVGDLSLLNGEKYTGVEGTTKVTVDANYITAGTVDDHTVENVFYYQLGLNGGDNPILTPEYKYVDNNGHSFTVPKTTDGWYLTPEMAPAGTYFHMVGTGSTEYDQIVYVSEAKLSYYDISESTIYTETTPNETIITIENAVGLMPALKFEKADAEGVFVTFPDEIFTGDYDENGVGHFTVEADNNYKGTWNVYADFSVDYYDESAEPMWSKTPVEYKFVKVGSFKIVADKADTDATLVTDVTEVTDGNVFTITVGADKGSKVTVEYYEDGDKADDADKIWEKGYDSEAKFYYVANQSAYQDDGTFLIPATKEVTIGIQADVKALTDKTFHFEVYVDTCAEEKKGGDDNPLTFDVKVKGNTFTANLAKTSYVKGESVTVEGTYSNTDENFKPYVYVEGTNTAFFAPAYAVKYTSAHQDGTAARSVKDGKYELVFDAKNFNELNAGTYTVYVSKEIWSGEAKGENVYNDDGTLKYSTKQYQEAGTKDKVKVIENAKVLTLVLKESMIEITAVTKEVQAGFNKNNSKETKGYYLTAQIEAEGADIISVYIVGQNKLFYIDGDYAVKYNYVKNLNKNNTANYLYYEDDSNPYAYDGIASDKSVSKVAQRLGQEKEDGTYYPLYLIVDNENGSFTVYIHIQATGENTDEDGYTIYPFDTELGLGQYYLVAQHPMADGIFNTVATLYDGEYYKSGANVYTNGKLMFNVPALQNLEAAQALITAIEAGNDSQHGKDFYVVAQANEAEFIKAPEASYKQGEIITIIVGNVNGVTYDNGTLEANTFDFTAENLNYIQTFAVTKKTNEDTGLETVTFTLDTSEVPGGDYVIVLKDDETVKKVYETKIIAKSTEPVIEVSVSIAGASSLTVGDTTVLTAKNSDGSTAKFAWKTSDASVASVDENGNVVAKKAGTVTITVENTVTGKTATKTIVVADKSTPVTPTKTPGFGILAALAGLGAVAALVLRRK